MSKIVVYTAITNAKDVPRSDIQVLSGYNKFASPVMNAKIYKVLPHKFLDYDISIWVDGNIFLNVPAEKLVDEWLGEADMAVFEHYHRRDLSWEAMMLNSTFKHRTPWVIDEVNRQIKHYEKIGMPAKEEVVMGGMLIRRNIPIVNQFNEAWWAEICRWSQRDQLSFPIVKRQFPNLKLNIIKGSIKSHPYLKYQDHAHYNT
ncbi:hypothetical protein A2630_01935 [Candidatus Woesebacteria bacterium RIFCSPHIGHO2_01_FULL_44_10]|uniref:TOD1/MUCI70 glycosyltransferase-like domain-containing protein n=1 Tax=Candidatus Woesebacteria bacterium RIFCSPLOWO2_01_FULL_44_14 TaxID=1802525 RepID=A0A1F8C2P6_9BACT|nr:MAG: hypothetical protein A2630_01935 [Candidatus Woesebacteria bacterium RIFCSPHIGHO2_01_FULL_44_10]OGM54584.1 MAG: hypothetical protein A3F62_03105 [Candidatus Woesebacteria bacterium RIFCSPHIGHO2_12_FULL_44_11]OGM70607.1 MAG: hypothetical protein A2975_00130 [Candidatus Woesebacteria bacterium RIFCSPLOWO2_01_FULL_44_14]